SALCLPSCSFFMATATTDLYTLSLHDALPIFFSVRSSSFAPAVSRATVTFRKFAAAVRTSSLTFSLPLQSPRPFIDVSRSSARRSEEHTSELQSRENLVCRLLLEKKNTIVKIR